jgi:hypothetical protein
MAGATKFWGVEVGRSLLWILANNPVDCGLTFAYEYNLFGTSELIELIPDGALTAVTIENRERYVMWVIDQILKHEALAQGRAS